MRHIPNFITSLNLASGFLAIIFIISGNILTAAWLILAAMIFDFLDGFASRLLNAYSDMGKELDSLADVVSFGVVPGLIIYHLLTGENNLNTEASGTSLQNGPAIVYAIIAAVFPVFAGLRLAKFNIDTTQSTSFKGLPTPAAALAVVSLVLASEYSDLGIVKIFTESAPAIIVFSLLISALMVSRIPMLALKMKTIKFRGNEPRYILVIICLVLIATMGIAGTLFIIPAYVGVSLFSAND